MYKYKSVIVQIKETNKLKYAKHYMEMYFYRYNMQNKRKKQHMFTICNLL